MIHFPSEIHFCRTRAEGGLCGGHVTAVAKPRFAVGISLVIKNIAFCIRDMAASREINLADVTCACL